VKLTAGQRSGVMVRIEFAHGELADLAEYGGLDWVTYQADSKSRRNVERIAENVANAVIDIAKILLAAGGSEVPETYREVLVATVPAGLADESQVADLIRLAQLRNRLSHRYLDYKWELVQWFLRGGQQAVTAWLARCRQAIGGATRPPGE
jgi:uncharacterized protein YutE (UPF0331/DUF86 family)